MSSANTAAWQSHSRRRTFAQDFVAELKKLCRPSTRTRVVGAGAHNEASFLDETSEVLLVKSNSGESFNHSLELKQSERGGKELEDHRTIFEFATNSSESGSKNATMIESHWMA